jgi:hypothetical protein
MPTVNNGLPEAACRCCLASRTPCQCTVNTQSSGLLTAAQQSKGHANRCVGSASAGCCVICRRQPAEGDTTRTQPALDCVPRRSRPECRKLFRRMPRLESAKETASGFVAPFSPPSSSGNRSVLLVIRSDHVTAGLRP